MFRFAKTRNMLKKFAIITYLRLEFIYCLIFALWKKNLRNCGGVAFGIKNSELILCAWGIFPNKQQRIEILYIIVLIQYTSNHCDTSLGHIGWKMRA